jgi:hypothetical protein
MTRRKSAPKRNEIAIAIAAIAIAVAIWTAICVLAVSAIVANAFNN